MRHGFGPVDGPGNRRRFAWCGPLLLSWGALMADELEPDDAHLLAAVVFAEIHGYDLSLGDYAEGNAVPLSEVVRAAARLRRRGCLTKFRKVDWGRMLQSDLRAVAEVEHGLTLALISEVFQAWCEAHPGRFDGWEPSVTFHADTRGRLQ